MKFFVFVLLAMMASCAICEESESSIQSRYNKLMRALKEPPSTKLQVETHNELSEGVSKKIWTVRSSVCTVAFSDEGKVLRYGSQVSLKSVTENYRPLTQKEAIEKAQVFYNAFVNPPFDQFRIVINPLSKPPSVTGRKSSLVVVAFQSLRDGYPFIAAGPRFEVSFVPSTHAVTSATFYRDAPTDRPNVRISIDQAVEIVTTYRARPYHWSMGETPSPVAVRVEPVNKSEVSLGYFRPQRVSSDSRAARLYYCFPGETAALLVDADDGAVCDLLTERAQVLSWKPEFAFRLGQIHGQIAADSQRRGRALGSFPSLDSGQSYGSPRGRERSRRVIPVYSIIGLPILALVGVIAAFFLRRKGPQLS